MREQRESLMVHLLDHDKAEAVALTVMAAQFGTTADELRAEGWRLEQPLVIAEIDKNRVGRGLDGESTFDWQLHGLSVAVICTEGVGWMNGEDPRITLPMEFGMSQSQTVQISAQVLWDMRSEEQVDLAEHVRKFGDRLESNFWLWHSRISKARAAA